jgi:hypothetical protein
MPDHNWVQIHRRSYDVLSVLVRSKFALPNYRQLCGVGDAGTWRITAQADLTILSDESMSVAGRVVYAQLGRLPTHTYRALVADSPSFTQYEGLDDLYQGVRQPQTGFNPAAFKRPRRAATRSAATSGGHTDHVRRAVATGQRLPPLGPERELVSRTDVRRPAPPGSAARGSGSGRP